MDFLESMKEKAKSKKMTIVLPEATDERVVKAAVNIVKEGTAKIILIANEDEIKSSHSDLDLSEIQFRDPKSDKKFDSYAERFLELRKHKGMTIEKAREQMLDSLYFGVMSVEMGDADGLVAGADHSTPEVLRPTLQIVKTAEGVSLVSAFFVLKCPDEVCDYGEDGLLIFGDCALNQNPNPAELAEIAKSCADSFKFLIGKEPKVAMLSHSTLGSAKHPDVDKVIEATRIAKEKYPELLLDGEMQLDAAIVSEVGLKKAPNSKVAGKANILIFPDLDAANIGYKLVERFARAKAYGPVCQGFKKPVNDLSRGCSVEDIEAVVAITAVQAISQL